jgi:hypothetical protein
MAKMQYVIDHPHQVDDIIRHANAWCTYHLQRAVLETTLLRMLDHYLHQLEVYELADWHDAWHDEVRALQSEFRFARTTTTT